MTCPHCDTAYKTISKLNDHLRVVWNKICEDHQAKVAREAAAAERARAKRKLEDSEADQPEADDSESPPAKKHAGDSDSLDASAS